MTEMKHEINVVVQNIELQIRTDKDPAYIKELAEFVDNRIQKITQNADFTHTVSSLKVALYVALDVAHELFESRRKSKDFEGNVQSQTEHLITVLKEGL